MKRGSSPAASIARLIAAPPPWTTTGRMPTVSMKTMSSSRWRSASASSITLPPSLMTVTLSRNWRIQLQGFDQNVGFFDGGQQRVLRLRARYVARHATIVRRRSPLPGSASRKTFYCRTPLGTVNADAQSRCMTPWQTGRDSCQGRPRSCAPGTAPRRIVRRWLFPRIHRSERASTVSTTLAVVMAAGKGTRMKSRAAQGAGAGLRPADDRLRARRAGRGRHRRRSSSWSAIGPTTCDKRLPAAQNVDVRRASRATGHRPCRDDVPRAAGRARRAGAGRGRRFAADAGRLDPQAVGRVRPRAARPACWAPATKTIRRAWDGSSATRPGDFVGIVEEKDATPEQRQIHRSQHELLRLQLPAICCAPWTRLRADNAQGEYYLTDCPGVLLASGQGRAGPAGA